MAIDLGIGVNNYAYVEMLQLVEPCGKRIGDGTRGQGSAASQRRRAGEPCSVMPWVALGAHWVDREALTARPAGL
ncbi:hypothetical protein DPM13_01105 [Paracoccus mutanolyticus]|uniref:Uncharacterized protein n=1 Tax=Paracoccus mutanolyticus TaxID=1499308 RepID=A0ABN5M3D9_9RHOB|nr:hypothetical protein DPM13_01105 [Paracoccus mutanolyticus]